MADENKVLFINADSQYGADELGLPYRDIMGEGVVEAGDFEVSQRALGANMSVDVAAGACWIKGDDNASLQPTYRYRDDAQNVSITAADPTDPRIDRIVAEVLDDQFSGVSKLGRVRAIDGTPTTGADLTDLLGAAAVPNNALLLANVLVAAGATDVEDADISDQRTRAYAGGGVAAPGLGAAGNVLGMLAGVPTWLGGLVKIAEEIRADSLASITISDIPQEHQHLIGIWTAKSVNPGTDAEVAQARFNGDFGNNYFQSGATLTAAYSGSQTTSAGTSVARLGRMGKATAGQGQGFFLIPNYAESLNHMILALNAAPNSDGVNFLDIYASYHGNGPGVAPITAINLFSSGASSFLASGSKLTLYGIGG